MAIQLIAEGPCGDTTMWQNAGDAAANNTCAAMVKAGEGILANILNTMIGFYKQAIGNLNWAWLNLPEPDLSSNGALGVVGHSIQFVTISIALMGFLVGVARIIIHNRASLSIELVRGMLILALVQGASLSTVQLLLEGGRKFSTWLMSTGINSPAMVSEGTGDTLGIFLKMSGGTVAVAGAAASVVGFIVLYLISILGLLMQIIFLIIRNVLLYILLAGLPWMAAGYLFSSGREGFHKALTWLVSCVAYKPIAALIYYLGFALMSAPAKTNMPGEVSQIMNILTGMCVVIAASLALPMLIKFLAPTVSAGVSTAFSGAAGASAAVAAGAAVATMGASAGAVAAGAGAGAASGGAGAASGGAGAASGGAGAASGGAGAASGGAGAASGGGKAGAGSGAGATAGGAAEPAPGGGSSAPAPGGGSSAPAPGGGSSAPAPGGGSSAPAPGGGSSAPAPASAKGGSAASGAAPAPAKGGSSSATDSSKGSNSAPAKGATRRPARARSAEDRRAIINTVSDINKAAAQGAQQAQDDLGHDR